MKVPSSLSATKTSGCCRFSFLGVSGCCCCSSAVESDCFSGDWFSFASSEGSSGCSSSSSFVGSEGSITPGFLCAGAFLSPESKPHAAKSLASPSYRPTASYHILPPHTEATDSLEFGDSPGFGFARRRIRLDGFAWTDSPDGFA